MSLRKQQPKSTQEGFSRQEIAIWLGRAMSTSEVTLRVVTQMLDLIHLQHLTLQSVHEIITQNEGISIPEELEKVLKEGTSPETFKRLDEMRQELKPVLKMIDDACKKLEKMI
jgi:hypothetical protein